MPYYELGSRFIPGHHQPGTVIDLALSRGIDSHVLLKGCGVFYEDVISARARLSPEQLLRLLGNAERLLPGPDTGFLLGHQWLPGHYDGASQMLGQARDLQQALELLTEFRALLSPLLCPVWSLDEQHLYLYLQHSFVPGPQQVFLEQLHATSLVALCRSLSRQRWPWRFQFSHGQPAYPEQYWVHLGENLQFDCPQSLLMLPREYLHQPWPQHNATACLAAQQQCRAQLQLLDGPLGLLDALQQYLHGNLRQPLSLERAAQHFGLSPSSLKRKLHKHGTGFQQQLDQARKHMALYLYQLKGYGNDEVAQYLAFNDTSNFRRSFRRWTGCSPSGLRHLLRQP